MDRAHLRIGDGTYRCRVCERTRARPKLDGCCTLCARDRGILPPRKATWTGGRPKCRVCFARWVAVEGCCYRCALKEGFVTRQNDPALRLPNGHYRCWRCKERYAKSDGCCYACAKARGVCAEWPDPSSVADLTAPEWQPRPPLSRIVNGQEYEVNWDGA